MLTAVPLAELITDDPLRKKFCSFAECQRRAIALGMCQRHYQRMRAGRDPDCATQQEEAFAAWLSLVAVDSENDAAWDTAWRRVHAAMEAWIRRRVQVARPPVTRLGTTPRGMYLDTLLEACTQRALRYSQLCGGRP